LYLVWDPCLYSMLASINKLLAKSYPPKGGGLNPNIRTNKAVFKCSQIFQCDGVIRFDFCILRQKWFKAFSEATAIQQSMLMHGSKTQLTRRYGS